MSDEDLERLPFPTPPGSHEMTLPIPSWPKIQKDLLRKSVTLLLLLQEYKSVHPEGKVIADLLLSTGSGKARSTFLCGSSTSPKKSSLWTSSN